MEPWIPQLGKGRRPAYLAIADALAADIAAGKLSAGARLPPQRTLARELGLNLTTVTRAMHEAGRRGLVTGVTGSGTFVAPRAERVGDWVPAREAEVPGEFLDLAVNVPPEVAAPELARSLASWASALGANLQECASLLPYRGPEGAVADRAAACEWLALRNLRATPGQVVITQGAQHGLALALGVVARPGDAVLCEELTYPGLRAAAASRGVRLVPVALDEAGLVPASVRRALREHRARALVCCPTLQNPTATVLPPERREELASIARREDLWLIEDDVYGPLMADAPAPLSLLAPERTLYVTSLSKAVCPGLRVGYVAAPAGAALDALHAGLRASTWTAAPLTVTLASTWIRNGVAQRAAKAIRSELLRRNAQAGKLLSEKRPSPSPHLWLPLPSAARESMAVRQLERAGVGVLAGESFRVGERGFGLRICLGAAPTRAALVEALRTVRSALLP